MNVLVLTMLLAIMQTPSPVPGKASDHATGAGSHIQSDRSTKNQPTAQSPSVIHPNESPAPKRDTGQQGDNNAQHTVGISKLPPVSITRKWPDWGLWVFNLLLVVVGGLQVWLLKGTLGVIRQQANLMGRQADLMERQASKLDESVAVANKTAIAAQASADAARKNIDILINKERPRVRVEIESLNLVLLPASGITVHKVDYKVLCYGSTPAFIVDSRARAEVTDSSAPPPIGGFPMSLPSVINPTVAGIKKDVWISPRFKLEQPEIDSIDEGKKFVHLCGFITYKDVFNNAWETRFRYVWRPLERLYNLGSKYTGYWAKCGPEEDNSET